MSNKNDDLQINILQTAWSMINAYPYVSGLTLVPFITLLFMYATLFQGDRSKLSDFNLTEVNDQGECVISQWGNRILENGIDTEQVNQIFEAFLNSIETFGGNEVIIFEDIFGANFNKLNSFNFTVTEDDSVYGISTIDGIIFSYFEIGIDNTTTPGFPMSYLVRSEDYGNIYDALNLLQQSIGGILYPSSLGFQMIVLEETGIRQLYEINIGESNQGFGDPPLTFNEVSLGQALLPTSGGGTGIEIDNEGKVDVLYGVDSRSRLGCFDLEEREINFDNIA